MGHDPVLDKDGNVDIFVVDIDIHSGPSCKICKKSWCSHCTGVEGIKKCKGPNSERILD